MHFYLIASFFCCRLFYWFFFEREWGPSFLNHFFRSHFFSFLSFSNVHFLNFVSWPFFKTPVLNQKLFICFSNKIPVFRSLQKLMKHKCFFEVHGPVHKMVRSNIPWYHGLNFFKFFFIFQRPDREILDPMFSWTGAPVGPFGDFWNP